MSRISHYSASVCAGDVIELVDGATSSEGRVQITRNGFKGTVCDDNFDMAAASVVCRMLQLGCVRDFLTRPYTYVQFDSIMVLAVKYTLALTAKELCHIC